MCGPISSERTIANNFENACCVLILSPNHDNSTLNVWPRHRATRAGLSATNKRGYLINSKFSALLKLLGLHKRHVLPKTFRIDMNAPDDMLCEKHNGEYNAYRANSQV